MRRTPTSSEHWIISNTQKKSHSFLIKPHHVDYPAIFSPTALVSVRRPYLATSSTCIYKRNLTRKTWKISKDLFLYLSRSDFDVEVASLVGYFKDLGPGESVDTQPVSIDQEATGTHPQHDVNAFRVL